MNLFKSIKVLLSFVVSGGGSVSNSNSNGTSGDDLSCDFVESEELVEVKVTLRTGKPHCKPPPTSLSNRPRKSQRPPVSIEPTASFGTKAGSPSTTCEHSVPREPRECCEHSVPCNEWVHINREDVGGYDDDTAEYELVQYNKALVPRNHDTEQDG